MHMADALLSPVVGGTMWGMAAAVIAHCSGKIRTGMDDRKIPLMGVMGAFVFAAQMVNFTIPVTGSSGHLGGGLLLSILLGPYAAFLTIASVLVVQAFFFADGGLLALGCNMVNLGFFPAFIAYPLVYKQIAGRCPAPARISVASMAAAITALQLGAFGVVLETVMSGIASLPFSTFAVIMQPIHLAIGAVEGLVTASVISFLHTARPELMRSAFEERPSGNYPIRGIVIGVMAVTLLTGGVVSRFASGQPDGLEWAITKVTGQRELKRPEQRVYGVLARMQERFSFLPGYSLKKQDRIGPLDAPALDKHDNGDSGLGTSISGVVGGALTLGLSLLVVYVLKRRCRTT